MLSSNHSTLFVCNNQPSSYLSFIAFAQFIDQLPLFPTSSGFEPLRRYINIRIVMWGTLRPRRWSFGSIKYVNISSWSAWPVSRSTISNPNEAAKVVTVYRKTPIILAVHVQHLALNLQPSDTTVHNLLRSSLHNGPELHEHEAASHRDRRGIFIHVMDIDTNIAVDRVENGRGAVASKSLVDFDGYRSGGIRSSCALQEISIERSQTSRNQFDGSQTVHRVWCLAHQQRSTVHCIAAQNVPRLKQRMEIHCSPNSDDGGEPAVEEKNKKRWTSGEHVVIESGSGPRLGWVGSRVTQEKGRPRR